jgi:hypothetical protein
VFSRFDYGFLFLFSLGNTAILLMFLRYMWYPAAVLPEDFAL